MFGCGLTPRAQRLEEWNASGLQHFRTKQDCSFNSTNPQSQYEPGNGSVLRVPVVWHVLHHTNNTGNISKTRIDQAIDILNEDFRAIAGTNGAPGTDTKIEFYRR